VPDPQSAGDPHIRGEVDNKMRSEANLETRDSIKFRMACSVVDIRPNGNLILEGRRTIRNNEEVWEYSITGEIRAKDVLPNNSILSENVADFRLLKRELGHVRDGYRRGWALKWLDYVQPF
jgi:flagellar L-ring protein precursor FlgH